MSEITKKQIIHDGAIDYLLRGCQRSAIDLDENELFPKPSHVFYRKQTHLHDLARFAFEISEIYPSVNQEKLNAGFCVGVYVVRNSDVPIRDFRIRTETFTTPDINFDDRIASFEKFAFCDSIYDLYDRYPILDSPKFFGKNYDLGVRAMLAAGYYALSETADTVESMNVEETKIWFEEALDFYKDKKTEIDSSYIDF